MLPVEGSRDLVVKMDRGPEMTIKVNNECVFDAIHGAFCHSESQLDASNIAYLFDSWNSEPDTSISLFSEAADFVEFTLKASDAKQWSFGKLPSKQVSISVELTLEIDWSPSELVTTFVLDSEGKPLSDTFEMAKVISRTQQLYTKDGLVYAAGQLASQVWDGICRGEERVATYGCIFTLKYLD